MIRALYTAASGLMAQQMNTDVIANNIANANTPGFKRDRINFQDLLYQTFRRAGQSTLTGSMVPTSLRVGHGVRPIATQKIFMTGAAQQTGNPLDLMINGEGFFQVKIPNSLGTDTGYTRAGNLSVTPDGELVIGNADGFKIEPPVAIPTDTTAIDIGADGRVFATLPSSVNPQEVGQIQLARFTNQAGLKPIGSTLFIETEASGTPILANPTEQGMGRLLQKFLESSNVDPVRELVELIKAQRAFELNSQSIKSADEMMQVIGNLRQF